MSKPQKLINKVTRLEKLVRKRGGKHSYDSVDAREEVMADSPSAYQLSRKVQRKLDRSFGKDSVAKEPPLAFDMTALSLERFDFGGGDWGMKLTLDSGIIEFVGIVAGDVVEMKQGSLEGQALKVESLESATELRLEDVASFGAPEADLAVRAELSTVKKGAS